jgi:hypothetical protein
MPQRADKAADMLRNRLFAEASTGYAPFRTFRQPDVEAQLGRKLALGVHKSAGFAVRKNVEIKSVQVFDLDV